MLNIKQNIIFGLVIWLNFCHQNNTKLFPSQFNTSLVDFTYTVAREAPDYLKRLLPGKYFRAILSEKAAMRFATKATMEQRIEFFSYLGIHHYWVFADNKDEVDFRNVFKQFDTGEKPGPTLKKLGEENVFVCSDKEFCNQLGYLGHLIDTSGYSRNAELLRTSYHIRRFKNRITTEDHKETIEKKDTSLEILKCIQAIFWTEDLCKDITGISLSAFRLLLYLAIHKSEYVSYDSMQEIFAGSMSARELFASRKQLINAALIQRHPAQKNHSWTITGKGILAVNQFRDKVIKSMDF